MREIKFRQWCNGVFHYWGHFQGGYHDPRPNPLFATHEQFTGLHDKNGKEIYEGDVLRHVSPRMRWVVRFGEHVERDYDWSHEWNGWYIIHRHDRLPLLREVAAQAEVIGNIHENPELLEEK